MQKYYITDGKQYIQKRGHKYVPCDSPVIAGQYTAKQAEDILRYNLSRIQRKYFYLEECDTFNKIEIRTPTGTKSVKKALTEKECKGKTDVNLSKYTNISGEIEKIKSVQFPTKKQLTEYQAELCKAITFYDRALSDISHWNREHKIPPAHIMTKNYMISHEYEVKRKNAKQELAYVNELIGSIDRNEGIECVAARLRSVNFSAYTPNTGVYEMLNQISGGRKNEEKS